MTTVETILKTKELIKDAENFLKGLEGDSPGDAVHKRATSVARERSVGYTEAVGMVLAEDQNLARSYSEETFEGARGNSTVRRS